MSAAWGQDDKTRRDDQAASDSDHRAKHPQVPNLAESRARRRSSVRRSIAESTESPSPRDLTTARDSSRAVPCSPDVRLVEDRTPSVMQQAPSVAARDIVVYLER